MKKIFTILAAAGLFLTACQKSEVKNVDLKTADATKYDVTFKIDDFVQSTEPLTTNRALKTSAVGDTLRNYADYLVYRIYNSNGVLVNSINQAYTLQTFGTITDKLPSGTYNVSLIASKGSIYTTDVATMYSSAVYNSQTNATWNETFATSFQLVVGTSAITQAVRLQRVIGGLEVTLQDAIPSQAKKISIVFQSDAYFLRLSDNNPSSLGTSVVKDFVLQSSDVGVKGKKFLMYVGNTVSPSSVIVRAYDANNSLLNEKTILNVRCYKNQKTLLTGSIFPTTQGTSTGFTVTVNPTWATPSTPIQF